MLRPSPVARAGASFRRFAGPDRRLRPGRRGTGIITLNDDRPNPDMTLRSLKRALSAAALALAALVLAPGTSSAQDPARPDSVRPIVVRRADVVRPEQPDTAPPRISPRGAFLRSLVLPGWGQSELGAPGRGAVYFFLEAGSLWMLYTADQKLDEARERQTILRRNGVLAPDARTPLVRDRENQKEDWITLSIFWLFFSGADAFVAAHLQDFDVHVNAVPRPGGGGTELRATVPVGP